MAETTQAHQATPPEKPRGITVEEWMEMLDQGKVEISNGEIVTVSPPNVRHVRIAHEFYDVLSPWIKERNLGVIRMEAPYLLEADERTNWLIGSKIPDLSFIAHKRYQEYLSEVGEDGPFRLAPDLAVEIVSPTDKYTDVNDKIATYLHHGVRLVWVIDPQQRVIRVYTPDQPDGHTLHEADTLSGDPVLPGWSAQVGDILGPK